MRPDLAFVRAVFGVPAHIVVPKSARFGVKAEMELFPGAHYQNWQPLPGRESDRWGDVDGEPEESDWCGRDQMVHPVGLDHYGLDTRQLYAWAQANCLDDPESWDGPETNMGIMVGPGDIRPCAHASDVDGMDWNVGGVTPVFVAEATIWPEY